MNSVKRLGVQELKTGMKVKWRKGGTTDDEVFEVVEITKRPRGKTIVHFKNANGVISQSWNAGNRYVSAE